MEAYARIQQAIGYLRFKNIPYAHEDIAKKLGRNRVNVTKAINGDERYLTTKFLKDFAEAYSDIFSKEWIISGDGEMVKPDDRKHPYVEAKAAAGYLGGTSLPDEGKDLRDIDSFFPKYDFLIRAEGESMEPAIFDGDVLICEKLTDSFNPPKERVCVIATNDGVLVKEISGVKGEHVLLHSFNPKVPDQRVEFSSINGIALVLGSLRPSM